MSKLPKRFRTQRYIQPKPVDMTGVEVIDPNTHFETAMKEYDRRAAARLSELSSTLPDSRLDIEQQEVDTIVPKVPSADPIVSNPQIWGGSIPGHGRRVDSHTLLGMVSGQSQPELERMAAGSFGVSDRAVRISIQALEQAGFVQRRAGTSTGGRPPRTVHLTDEGQKAASSLHEPYLVTLVRSTDAHARFEERIMRRIQPD